MDSIKIFNVLDSFSRQKEKEAKGCTLYYAVFSSLLEPLSLLNAKFPEAYNEVISLLESKK